MTAEENSVDVELPYSMDGFDFVEVDNNTNDQDMANEEEELEFAFPLFSVPEVSSNDTDDKKEDMPLRQQIIVTLRGENEDTDAIVEQHNKKQADLKYGKIQYSVEAKKEFVDTAVDYDDVFKTLKYHDKKSNSLVEPLKIGELIHPVIKQKKKKLGQKQRLAKRLGKEREEARKLKDLEMKKLIKKKFHKRGGKRNANAKPKSINKIIKFKTE
jgi:hypothetical protein